MNPARITGGCLCGAVRYESSGPPIPGSHCHCVDCRRHAGAPFVTWAGFRRSDLRFLTAPPRETAWVGRLRGSCPQCGTALIITDGPDAAVIDVTVASFDDPAVVTPVAHIWTEDRLPWVHLADGLPIYPQARPATVDNSPGRACCPS